MGDFERIFHFTYSLRSSLIRVHPQTIKFTNNPRSLISFIALRKKLLNEFNKPITRIPNRNRKMYLTRSLKLHASILQNSTKKEQINFRTPFLSLNNKIYQKKKKTLEDRNSYEEKWIFFLSCWNGVRKLLISKRIYHRFYEKYRFFFIPFTSIWNCSPTREDRESWKLQ
jgi:hypothetical protein